MDVYISASTQFMDMKLWESIFIVILYMHANFWANLRHGQEFSLKAFNNIYQAFYRSCVNYQEISHFSIVVIEWAGLVSHSVTPQGYSTFICTFTTLFKTFITKSPAARRSHPIYHSYICNKRYSVRYCWIINRNYL